MEPTGRGDHIFYIPVPDLPDDFAIILDFSYIIGGVKLQLGSLTVARKRFYDELCLQDTKGILDTGVLTKPFLWIIEKQGNTFTVSINGEEIVKSNLPDFDPVGEIILDFGQEDYALSKIEIVGRDAIASETRVALAEPNTTEGRENTSEPAIGTTAAGPGEHRGSDGGAQMTPPVQ